MIAFLFPGQGSQHVGMGEALFGRYPDLVASANAILGYSLQQLCLQDPEKKLGQTAFTQPALYVVNALSWRAKCEDTGQAPAFAAGHSLGEYNALECAGVLPFEQGLRLVQRRGALMGDVKDGGMAAILGLEASQVREVLERQGFGGVDVANFNGPNQTVISGLKDDVSKTQQAFEAQGAMFVPLNVSGAFHSRYMQPARAAFENFLASFAFGAPHFPIIANATAQPYDGRFVARTLADQLTQSVRWVESMVYLLDQGVTEFVEVGPRDVLTKMMKGIRRAYTPRVAADQRSTNAAPLSPAFAPAALPTLPSEGSAFQPLRTFGASVTGVTGVTGISGAPQLSAADRVAAWNKAHAVGTAVRVQGYADLLRTKSEAMVLFGHRAAVYMDGYNGYFALDEVEAAEESRFRR